MSRVGSGIWMFVTCSLDSFGGTDSKDCLQCRRPGFDPWVRGIPWRRKWLLTLMFLPGESYGQRSLEGYGP